MYGLAIKESAQITPEAQDRRDPRYCIRMDHVAAWLESLADRGKAQSTIKTYTRELRQLFRWMDQSPDIVSLGPGGPEYRPTEADMWKWKRNLDELHPDTPNTSNNYLIAAKAFFKWLAVRGIYPDVCQSVTKSRTTNGQSFAKGYLTKGQAKRLLQSVDRSTLAGKRDYAILALMLSCGLRCIEVVRADVQDINTDAGERVIWVQGKGHRSKDDYVILPDEVDSAIANYLQARGDYRDADPLFISTANCNRGSRLTARSLGRIVTGYMDRCGYRRKAIAGQPVHNRITPHSLRHTCGYWINREYGAETAQKTLRHADPKTTQIYTKMSERAGNKGPGFMARTLLEDGSERK